MLSLVETNIKIVYYNSI